MKKAILTGVMILLIFISCEKHDDLINPYIFLKTGTGLEFRYNDIELYDSSTHIIYFKTSYKEFNDILTGPFTFFENGDTIYTGSFIPGYSSFIPLGPIILSPPHMYGDYALRIEIWMDNKPDVRNSPRIIELLKKHDLLHSGLSGSINSLELNGTQLSFTFTVVNHDPADLLIIDLNKTGPNLFHYFTNGLYIRDSTRKEVFSGNIAHQKPEPWNSWNTEWLSILKSGDSLSFTINYTIETPINPGEYNLLFEFPGLAYQVSKDQLFQGNNRIWLGDITLRKRLIIP